MFLNSGVRMKIKDGVLVLIITACSYLYTYVYYLGYFRTKGIPDDFIDIQLVSILKVGVFLLAFLGLMSFFIDLLTSVSESESNEDSSDNMKLSEPWRLFLKRNSVIIITILLAMMDLYHKPTTSKVFFIIFVVYFIFNFEFAVCSKKNGKKWYQRRFVISLKPPRVTGTIKAAHKFNVLQYYVYFSWGMSALLLMYFIGVTIANDEKNNLMCNEIYHVLQVNSDSVLATKDFKEFKFIEKPECSFTTKK